MISTVRMCDRVRAALVKRQRSARRNAELVKILRIQNRKLRGRLGIARDNWKRQEAELRAFRKAQMRLPL